MSRLLIKKESWLQLHERMFLQVIMSQLCAAVHIICPHVLSAASSAAVQLFTQKDSDHTSASMLALKDSANHDHAYSVFLKLLLQKKNQFLKLHNEEIKNWIK